MKHFTTSGRHNGQASLLGKLLKEKRDALGMSQAELAALIGVSRPYLSRLEHGEYEHPSPQVLQHVAQQLNICLDDLYAITGLTLPDDLPDYVPYLHAKHPELPDDALQELADYYEFITQKYAFQHDRSH